MTSLLVWFSNQVDRLACAAATESASLALDAGGAAGWGVGSYHAGEVLLRRRPSEPPGKVPLTSLVDGLRAPSAVIAVRREARASRTLENTPPFRFGPWLGASLGALASDEARAAMRSEVAPFLARNIHGDTDGELLFHRALTSLHESDAFDDPEVTRAPMLEALRRVFASVDALGVKGAPLSLALCHDRGATLITRGFAASWVRRQGVRDCPACKRNPVPDDALRYVMFAVGTPVEASGWKPVDPLAPTVLSVDSGFEVHVADIGAVVP